MVKQVYLRNSIEEPIEFNPFDRYNCVDVISYSNGIKLNLKILESELYLKGVVAAGRESESPCAVRGYIELNTPQCLNNVQGLSVKLKGYCVDFVHFWCSPTQKYLKTTGKRKFLEDVYTFSIDKSVESGYYVFPFQFLIQNEMPESIRTVYGAKAYQVEVEFNTNEDPSRIKTIFLHQEIKVLRRLSLTDYSLKSEMILSTGVWRHKVKYEVNIGSKVYEMDKSLPIVIDLEIVQGPAKICEVEAVFVQIFHHQVLKSDTFVCSRVPATINKCESFVLKRIKNKKFDKCGKLKLEWALNLKNSPFPSALHPYTDHSKLPNDAYYQTVKGGLKVTHEVRINMSMEEQSGEKSKLCLKAPIYVAESHEKYEQELLLPLYSETKNYPVICSWVPHLQQEFSPPSYSIMDAKGPSMRETNVISSHKSFLSNLWFL